MGVCSDGGLHKEGVSPNQTYRGGLQSRGQHRLQVSGREPHQSGASPVLRQRVSGIQRTEVRRT